MGTYYEQIEDRLTDRMTAVWIPAELLQSPGELLLPRLGNFGPNWFQARHILASHKKLHWCFNLQSCIHISRVCICKKSRKNISWGKRFEVARGYEEIVQDMTGFPKIRKLSDRPDRSNQSNRKVLKRWRAKTVPSPYNVYIYNHHTIMCVYIIYTWTTPLKSMSDSDQEIFLNQGSARRVAFSCRV